MSDRIPLHVQEEIMKRLPVRSLIQFRSVSKEWKSLIESSDFIVAHSLHRHTQQQHLLVSDEDLTKEKNYVSYIDDDTFPQQRSVLTLPLFVKQRGIYLIGGSSHGLFCFYNNLPTKPLQDIWCATVIDRFIYWHDASQTRNMIMSFDLTNESFEVIALPDSAAYTSVYFSKLRESVVVYVYRGYILTVWMLDHGVEKTFTELFNIQTHDSIVGFSKNGLPIMQVTDGDPYDSDGHQQFKLVYEPNSEHNNVLEISPYTFTVNSYMETLLLLGRSDCHSH